MKNNLSKIIKNKVEIPFLLKFTPTKKFYNKVEISAKMFWLLYRNEKQPTARQIYKLCEFFDVEVGELITLPKQGRLFDIIPPMKINRGTIVQLKHFSEELNSIQQANLNQIIKTIENNE